MQAKESEAAAETTRAAGRGGLAIATAKVSFILFGAAQPLVFTRLLGRAAYGEIAVVLSVVSVVNNVVVAMAIQGVSRAVSQVPVDEADQAFRRTLQIHVLVAMALSLGFALVAPWLAVFMSVPQLTTHFRLVAGVVLLYGIYAPLVGSLNGKRRFLEQAGLDISYAVIRLCSMVGGTILLLRSGGNGGLGAVAGFIIAASVIVPLALTRSGIGKPGGSKPAISSYLSFPCRFSSVRAA